MRRLWGCHARAALPSGSRSVDLEVRRIVSGRSAGPRSPRPSSRCRIHDACRRTRSEARSTRFALGHRDWTACCEDRRVRWASCKREVRDRGASPPSRALRGLEPTRILSAAERGTPLTRYVQARVPKCDIPPRQNGGTDRASWSRRSGTPAEAEEWRSRARATFSSEIAVCALRVPVSGQRHNEFSDERAQRNASAGIGAASTPVR
jgi:hypothetical protein